MDLPENVRKFIFEFIDSVEMLEVLLLIYSQREKSWDAQMISSELRSNLNSVEKRSDDMTMDYVRGWIYLIRLFAFILIMTAVINKNRPNKIA